ncbi:hypothetical protein BDZ45DRAFT_737496 [Acephala macrosclerotiorum]|nr:hypothetical protein BDZ45DRAFT_737496 [Acephala macrosclerotiorum]
MLTTQERNKMQSSTNVTVAVGPKKKLYFLPKSIISYYSSYFQCAFENAKKLELLDEETENFDVIVDYMMRNIIPGEKNANSKRTIEGNKDTIAQCLRFLGSADKYEMGDVSEVLYGPLSKAICDLSFHKRRGNSPIRSSKAQQPCGIEGSEIERIFSLCPAGSRLRTLTAQAALSFSGPQALDTWAEQTENIPGFAGELMGQLATSFYCQQWMDPVIKQKRQ